MNTIDAMSRQAMRRFAVAWVVLILEIGLPLTSVTVAATDLTASVRLPKDVVLVLDNSGSMKENDPDFLVKRAVEQFVQAAPANTWLGILIFDEVAKLAVPLTSLAANTRDTVLADLDQVMSYQGQWTNSPVAIEQAIRELQINGREDATKSIVFITDGIIDTGDRSRDLEGTRRLRQELAVDAARSGIRIYPIALSDEADFQLLQSLAQKTRGNYFRAVQAENMARLLEHTQIAISIDSTRTEASRRRPQVTPQYPAARSGEPVATSLAMSTPEAPGLKAIAEPPKPAKPTAIRNRVTMWLVGLSTAVILLIFGVTWALVRGKKASKISVTPPANEYMPTAFLYDVNGVTGRDRYELNGKLTLIGRFAPDPAEQVDHVLIGRSTIGRRHARIVWKNHDFWLIDQKSVNGTFVNGQRLTDEVPLKHGDRIRFHNVEFEFAMLGMELSDETIVVIGSASDRHQSLNEKLEAAWNASQGLTPMGPSRDFELGAHEDTDVSDGSLQSTEQGEGTDRIRKAVSKFYDSGKSGPDHGADQTDSCEAKTETTAFDQDATMPSTGQSEKSYW